MADQKNFEVIIIGGSYSGLSAVLTLGRSLRSTLIIDAGKPCNRQTPHSQNFLTQDGATPHEISTIAKKDVQKYDSVHFHDGFAISGRKTTNGFEIVTSDGAKFHAEKLVFATGIKDLIPDIPGFSECWGISIIHCPYCHGYEHKENKTAILASGEHALHLAPLVKNLTDNLTIITPSTVAFTEEQANSFSEKWHCTN